MIWQTHFFRAADEASAKAAIAMLPALGSQLLQKDGSWRLTGDRHALDLLGALVSAPAILNDEGAVITPAQWYKGWHFNLRLRPGDGAADSLVAEGATLGVDPVFPPTPARDWC